MYEDGMISVHIEFQEMSVIH